MKKTERKSILPKLVVILLIVMLISTSLLSRTLAKYVTTGNLLNDTARVAKWGVVITAPTDRLFSTTYTTHDTTYNEDNTVISASSELVVAPGTSGTISDFSITGSPEVASRLGVTVNSGSKLSGWVLADGTTAYEPVVWSLTEGTTTQNNLSFADLLTELGEIAIEFDPNVSLADGLSLTIAWEWPFSGNDVNDTILGDATTAPTITLDFDVTLTQID
ncbi:MAG: hypothetical protein GX675_06680 [Erysipelotrichaceae bacterium]|nr:hypothetical protein [Erysipelotrichaceae bacterium]